MIKFPNANQLSVGFNLKIFDEIYQISREIYLANQKNLNELFLTSTDFTNLNNSVTLSNVQINSSTNIIESPVLLPVNTTNTVRFIGTMLPSPLLGSLSYFVKPQNPYEFKIATTYQNLQENHFIDIITDVSTPINAKFLSSNEYNSSVWSRKIRDPAVKNNIEQVIKYFDNLYYKITFKPLDNTQTTSCWHVRW